MEIPQPGQRNRRKTIWSVYWIFWRSGTCDVFKYLVGSFVYSPVYSLLLAVRKWEDRRLSEFYFQCVYSSLTYPLSVLSLIPSNLVFFYLPSKRFSHWPLMSGSAATALVGVLRTSRIHFYADLIAVAHLHWAFMLRFVVHNCCAHDLLTMQVTVALMA